jgi:hypothetical protein
MAAKWQRIKVDLSGYDLTIDEKNEVADLIIERIVDRTQQGKDKDGRRFSGYSQSYKDSLDFKIAGKSPGKVDLQLSGDMLAALAVLDKNKRSTSTPFEEGSKKRTVIIGFEPDSEENAKADGNIRGTYGQSKPIPGKARDFLGITDRELDNIIRLVKNG